MFKSEIVIFRNRIPIIFAGSVFSNPKRSIILTYNGISSIFIQILNLYVMKLYGPESDEYVGISYQTKWTSSSHIVLSQFSD
jgi:hypothetical protein